MEEKLKQYIELLAIDIKDYYNSTLWKEHALKNFYKIVGQIEPPVIVPERNFFGQWHFTKDELPELDKSVLCYVKIKDIDGDEYETLAFGKRFINYTQQPVFVADAGSFSKGEEIICWMYVKEIPLPNFERRSE